MEYVTVTQAAALLGITPQAVRARIASGQLAAEKMSARLLLVPRSAIGAAPSKMRNGGRRKGVSDAGPSV